MKKSIKILAVLAAIALLFCGCNKTSTNDTDLTDTPAQSIPADSQKFSTEGMMTVGGETVVVDGTNGFAEPELGFGLVYSETMKRLMPDNFGFSLIGSCGVMAMYAPDAVISIVSDPDAAEAQIQDAVLRYYHCFAIVRVTDDIGDEGESILPRLREMY